MAQFDNKFYECSKKSEKRSRLEEIIEILCCKLEGSADWR
jgi:hypothetical protein